MKLVYENDNRAILYSMKNILEMNNIATHVRNEHGSTMGPELGISNTFLQLCIVNNADYEDALSVIKNQLESQESETSWSCSKCNETNEGSFELCWNCQNERKGL